MAASAEHPGRGTAGAVLGAFLVLGLTSFGGPVAHLGFFRREFVERRRWLDERSYTDLLALCQFLPGPASSQLGMAIGLARAGWRGALAAWVGFTLPSALALVAFAYGVRAYPDVAASPAVHGLKLAAVAVVAQAVWGMSRTLCPDRPRAALAWLSALATLAWPGTAAQLGAIVACALAGGALLRLAPAESPRSHPGFGVSRRAGALALAGYAALLLVVPAVAVASGALAWQLVEGVLRAGALVFGGGHVVLPLLQAAVVPPGAVSEADFLAGYGAAQAVPGPLFTFAAYLGARASAALMMPGWLAALVFLVAIFLPGMLLVIGALPFWDALRRRAGVQSAMAGINAAVVGILASALYDPVWTSAVHTRGDFAIALAAFGLLVLFRVSPVWVVGACAIAAWALASVAGA